ncbi:PEP-CTERM sorting domain-containing protein [Rhodopirellula bahusiensis]|uniref:Ice-binding protein C-terminal domain-containing protein n=1 Tax=Rhodopirellula bahusiensis TaxID=2014065 RepID=A0A2G1W2M3_9BACT|nr:hypothetical protein CEE69_21150 [Rhodopirellula bahusiensis]
MILHSTVPTAVPEPSSLAIIAMGGVGLALRRRKTNQAVI